MQRQKLFIEGERKKAEIPNYRCLTPIIWFLKTDEDLRDSPVNTELPMPGTNLFKPQQALSKY
jgi:hypothetical protein